MNAWYHYWYYKSAAYWGWVFNPGHDSIITLSLRLFLCSSYVIHRLCTIGIAATIEMEVQCAWVAGKNVSYVRQSDPRYYMVKYSHTGLEQVYSTLLRNQIMGQSTAEIWLCAWNASHGHPSLNNFQCICTILVFSKIWMIIVHYDRDLLDVILVSTPVR